MKHAAITTHTFSTDEGTIITVELRDERPRNITIKFPGSGRAGIELSHMALYELADLTTAVAAFLKENEPETTEAFG